MRILELDPECWYRGNGSEGSRLLRPDGQMCCLGFEALSRGCTEEEIYEESFPSYIGESIWDTVLLDRSRLPEDLQEFLNLGHVPDALEQAIGQVNDSPTIDEESRFAWLKLLFKQVDIDLRLKDG